MKPTIVRPSLDVLGKMRAYYLTVTLWTARKKLVAEDFNTSADNLPPSDLASLGSKKICPPESIRIFNTLKSRAVATLNKVGIKFLGAYLVPEEKVFETEKILSDIQKEFGTEKSKFLQKYTDITDSWIAQHPEYAVSLQNAIDSPAYIERQLQFSWENFAFAHTQNNKFVKAFGKVADTLLEDIVNSAENMWKEVFQNRTELTKKSLSPLRTLNNKLASFGYIEPRIAPVSALISAALSKVENASPVSGTDLLLIQGLVCLLRDTDKTLEYAQMVLDGASAGDLVCTLSLPVENQTAAAYTTPIVQNTGVTNKYFVDSKGLW